MNALLTYLAPAKMYNNMGINRVISFFVLFIAFSNALKSQVQINEEVVRRDSTLFVQLGIETDICPMMDLKLGVAIDQFLRAKKRLEKKNAEMDII